MDSSYDFLLEKDALWADIYVQVLRENGIPCEAFPVHGAGAVIRGGLEERLRLYVPSQQLQQAETLLQELFSADNAAMEE